MLLIFSETPGSASTDSKFCDMSILDQQKRINISRFRILDIGGSVTLTQLVGP
jgi:hypothetical protein